MMQHWEEPLPYGPLRKAVYAVGKVAGLIGAACALAAATICGAFVFVEFVKAAIG